MILEFQNMPTRPSRNLQREIAQITSLSHVFFLDLIFRLLLSSWVRPQPHTCSTYTGRRPNSPVGMRPTLTVVGPKYICPNYVQYVAPSQSTKVEGSAPLCVIDDNLESFALFKVNKL